ncbi:uncharacterized protein LOC120081562 isoform X4 [Benincasa hispida]|uniref:uncharacterized protein LOC120081562 isoform X4 n=1 Tax=Benincasa hispida TaxID=102211 RepID=UPI0018FF6BE4|nr:uncharacterized protein LOC120081562 isoform X4 [Benincasa hispida]
MKLWRLRLPALLRCRENWTILEEPLSLRLRSLLFLKMAEYGEITADPTIESCSKEGCDSKFTKHFADDIIPHILNLYGSTATPRDFEIYAPDASFEDPLTRAYGVKEIKSAFYSLSKSVQDVLQRKGLPGGKLQLHLVGSSNFRRVAIPQQNILILSFNISFKETKVVTDMAHSVSVYPSPFTTTDHIYFCDHGN